jgi:signal transduction histidine kinase
VTEARTEDGEVRFHLRLGGREGTVTVPATRVEQGRGTARTIFVAPFQRRAWSELALFLISGFVGSLGAVIIVGSMGLGVVAELLANVAQHSRAWRAAVSCVEHGPGLRIVVRDHGRGGAMLTHVGSSSTGLAGLTDRVRTVDGHLDIASPPGGPTAITVDLPGHA